MLSSARIKSGLISVFFFACAVFVGVGATTQEGDARMASSDARLEVPAGGAEREAAPSPQASSTAVASTAPAASSIAPNIPSPAVAPAASTATPDGSAASQYRLFPSVLGAVASSGGVQPEEPSYGPVSAPSSETEAPAAETSIAAAERQPVLAGNQVLAFYGKPGSPSMGILGEYAKEKLAPLLEGYAKLYDAANGELGVVPAFYIIYGTCWPEGEIGVLRRSVVEEYIKFAAERGWIVFLDHQLGKYSVEDSVKSMLPFLRYPNVHLAIDPEWRTLKPMKEIGSITGTELNTAQRMVDDYLRDNGLPGIRMLVVHQFRPTMIRDSTAVNATFDRVVLVHTADGFGPPSLKKYAYASNARSANMPVKGFKLFFESKVLGAGWDNPLMKPEEVIALDPMPLLVMYQ